eukprot:XP_001703855.1 Hypothetical protein GL50803_116725 [Giardia lamblia ATCC 50803]
MKTKTKQEVDVGRRVPLCNASLLHVNAGLWASVDGFFGVV